MNFDEILRPYLEGFWGYGNPLGRTWLIGMEHGGGASEDELRRRLDVWDNRGRRSFEDLHEYHLAFGELRWTGPRPRLQTTWRRLILTLLAVSSQPDSTEDVRAYQSSRFGRQTSDHCVLELMPLPAKSLGDWPYGQWSQLDELSSRDAYRDSIGPRRRLALHKLIDQYRPPRVLFYGLSYCREYEAVAGTKFTNTEDPDIQLARNHDTTYVLVCHPASHAARDQHFRAAGKCFLQI